jgi:hypothetical protein
MNVELMVSLNEYLKNMGYCDEHVEDVANEFYATGAVSKVGGQEFISVPKYGIFILDQLQEFQEKALHSNNCSDHACHRYLAVDFLNRWVELYPFILTKALEMRGTDRFEDFKIAYSESIVTLEQIANHIRENLIASGKLHCSDTIILEEE